MTIMSVENIFSLTNAGGAVGPQAQPYKHEIGMLPIFPGPSYASGKYLLTIETILLQQDDTLQLSSRTALPSITENYLVSRAILSPGSEKSLCVLANGEVSEVPVTPIGQLIIQSPTSKFRSRDTVAIEDIKTSEQPTSGRSMLSTVLGGVVAERCLGAKDVVLPKLGADEYPKFDKYLRTYVAAALLSQAMTFYTPNTIVTAWKGASPETKQVFAGMYAHHRNKNRSVKPTVPGFLPKINAREVATAANEYIADSKKRGAT